ncbi:peptidase M28 [Thiocystis violacea]|nr:peptidase M28 [Thiocystis violacea]
MPRRLRSSGLARTRSRRAVFLAAVAFFSPIAVLAATPQIEHRLAVRLEPDTSGLQVEDEMRFPEGKSEWIIILHSDLDPRVTHGEAELTELDRAGHLSRYRLQLDTPGPVTIRYAGSIRHAMEQIDEGMGRMRQWSLGVIRPEGIFLDGNSGWYPRVPDSLQTFQLSAQLPAGWTAVSQGAGPGDTATGRSTWTEPHPQDDIYLIAGRYHVYRSDAEGFEAQVYLREPDAALADRYLKATHDYIGLYSNMIGPYPFAKFALVENFWETGYGMPSFTLLGPSVIRLPFIIRTSYPHEVLHNWWGNSVFVDDSGGNWCEGLTNYLADYWLKEQAGQGAEARREMLKSYGDYVREGTDFPLVEFRGKHDLASQGIGYSKAAMVFHMLRGRLGDPLFEAGLKAFYAQNQFRAASYDDLRAAFEGVSGQDLGGFFRAWTRQPGAPWLALADVRVDRHEGRYRLSGRIRQEQPGAAFPLRIPLVVAQEDGKSTRRFVESDGADTAFEAELTSQPVRVAVDPDFDLFRALLPGETPITLSTLFGSDSGLILLPADAPRPLKEGYARLARAWQGGHPQWQVREDAEIDDLPSDRPVWILGWENRYLEAFAEDASGFAIDTPKRQIDLDGGQVDGQSESPVLTRDLKGRQLAWLATAEPAQLVALARKLPHYGKYSYLVFSGPDSSNRIKGQWPAGDSALTLQLVPGPP